MIIVICSMFASWNSERELAFSLQIVTGNPMPLLKSIDLNTPTLKRLNNKKS